jgi:uncharacterized membrane protein
MNISIKEHRDNRTLSREGSSKKEYPYGCSVRTLVAIVVVSVVDERREPALLPLIFFFFVFIFIFGRNASVDSIVEECSLCWALFRLFSGHENVAPVAERNIKMSVTK